MRSNRGVPWHYPELFRDINCYSSTEIKNNQWVCAVETWILCSRYMSFERILNICKTNTSWCRTRWFSGFDYLPNAAAGITRMQWYPHSIKRGLPARLHNQADQPEPIRTEVRSAESWESVCRGRVRFKPWPVWYPLNHPQYPNIQQPHINKFVSSMPKVSKVAWVWQILSPHLKPFDGYGWNRWKAKIWLRLIWAIPTCILIRVKIIQGKK